MNFLNVLKLKLDRKLRALLAATFKSSRISLRVFMAAKKDKSFFRTLRLQNHKVIGL